MPDPEDAAALGAETEGGTGDQLAGDQVHGSDLVDISERATLGALLLAPPGTAAEILKMVEDNDFRDPRCRFVCSIIRGMHASGEPVDQLTVQAHVQRRGLLRAGEPRMNMGSWLDETCRLAPVPMSGTWYAGSVIEAAARRKVLGVAEHLVLAADSGSLEDLAEVIERGLQAARAAVSRAEASR